MLQQGEIIEGKYRIQEQIGKGGMSNVYVAVDENDEQWAIKEIRKSKHVSGAVVRQNFVTEAKILNKLKHEHLPGIVKILDQDDTYIIIMEYIEGRPLKAVTDENGAHPQEDVIKWGIQLCHVLEYMHSRKPAVIYRDIKPHNIMLRPDGNIKLIDFGTAREYKKGAEGDTENLGTKGYAAPEQYGGEQTDERTDIYNLGATMYHLVTGKSPTKPPYEIRPIRHWDSALSTGLETIIGKCTASDPKERYQTAKELRNDLEHYKDMEIETLTKKRRAYRVFVAACILSAAAFLGGAVTKMYANSIQLENDDAKALPAVETVFAGHGGDHDLSQIKD